MTRLPWVFEFLGRGLFEVGLSMLSGDYYADPKPWEGVMADGRDRVSPDTASGE